jgi:hypothetical protein
MPSSADPPTPDAVGEPPPIGPWRRVLPRRAHLRPFHWREAALCVPALPLILIGGQLSGYPVQSATAAGAAFAVAFGAAREMRGRRWAAMVSAMVGMVLAAFAGTLLGQDSAAFILVAALAAAGCGALALYDEDVWWVVLQVVIVFLVAGYYHGGVAAASGRATMVLLGGMIEIGSIVALARLFPNSAAPFLEAAPLPPPELGTLVRHVLRAGLCVAASLAVIQPLGLANGYWAPMTALIVLKPRLRDTRARGLARLGGTLGGCLVATAFAALTRGDPVLLMAGATAAAGAAYALQKAHYAGLTASITATIVLLVSLGSSDAVENAEHRIAATLIGGGLALLFAILIPRGRVHAGDAADRVGTSPA